MIVTYTVVATQFDDTGEQLSAVSFTKIDSVYPIGKDLPCHYSDLLKDLNAVSAR